LSALAAGATLCDGRYRLEAVLGRGGMAIVWRATDLQLERDVAIKVISDALAGDSSFVARFEREARLAAGLNHPNLVKLFDYSADAERPFLVMEYIAGGTLAQARERRLDVDSLARDLLDSVAHIHAAGILHRDVKPSNVLLDKDDAPRLTDFGIARGDETSNLTLTGQVLGTLRYIAPEVAAGEPATVQSDLYGLGVLLSELNGTPSEPLARLIARMRERNPTDRPRSAAEALAGLEPTALLDTEEPTKPLKTTGGLTPFTDVSFTSERGQTPVLWRGIRPSRAVAAALALVALVVVVIAVASGGGSAVDRLNGATTTVRPAAPGAPASRQLDRLEQIVRGLPERD
jgi:predicted Ser/Thr protein kinase